MHKWGSVVDTMTSLATDNGEQGGGEVLRGEVVPLYGAEVMCTRELDAT